jgi:hypothetical protein
MADLGPAHDGYPNLSLVQTAHNPVITWRLEHAHEGAIPQSVVVVARGQTASVVKRPIFFFAGHDRIGSMEQRSVAGKKHRGGGFLRRAIKGSHVGTLDSRGRSDLEIDLHKLCNQNNANNTMKIDSTDGSRRSSIFEQTSRSTTSADKTQQNKSISTTNSTVINPTNLIPR